MKAIKENAGSLFLSLAEIAVGILLLVNPVGFTAGIIIAAGVLLLALGLRMIVHYFTTNPGLAQQEQSLARGLALAALGSFCVLQTKWVIAAFPVLTVLYGAVLLLTGLYKTQTAIDMLRLHRANWGWAALSAALSILFALLIFMNPFGTTVALWTFTAITLIVEAVLDIVYFVLTIRRGKEERAGR